MKGACIAFLFTLFLPALAADTVKGKIVGSVAKLVGDHMPTTDPQGIKGTTSPIEVPIYVFRGKVTAGPGLGSPRPDDERVVAIVRSKKDGTFEVQLPAGTYTVFALIGKKLYLNHYDGLNNFRWVSVSPGKETKVQIEDTREAAF